MTARASASPTSSAPPPQNLAVLKAVVVVLGVLFVVGFLALIAALVMRSSDTVDESAPAAASVPAASVPAAGAGSLAAELSVALPVGAQNIVSSAGRGGVSVQFTVPAQPDVTHVWLIDVQSGAVVSKIALSSTAEPGSN